MKHEYSSVIVPLAQKVAQHDWAKAIMLEYHEMLIACLGYEGAVRLYADRRSHVAVGRIARVFAELGAAEACGVELPPWADRDRVAHTGC